MSQVGQAGYPQGNSLYPTSVGTAVTKPVGHNQNEDGLVGYKIDSVTGVIEISAPIITRKTHLREFLLSGESIDYSGATSMRAIIQRAFDLLTVEYAAGKGPQQLVLPEGRFGLSSNITQRTGVGIIGVDQAASVLVPLGDFAAIRGEIADYWFDDVCYADLSIDCSAHSISTFDSTRKGFYVKRMNRPRWDRVVVVNAAATAFGCDFISGGVFNDCEAVNSGRAAVDRFGAGAGFGIAVGLSEVESVVLNNCKSRGHGTSGLYLEFSPANGATHQPRGIIANNFQAEGGYVGICDAGARALQVNGGALEGNKYHGFLATQNGASTKAGTQGRLQGVLISGNGKDYGPIGAGVSFSETAEGVEYTIDGCDIIGNAHGITAEAPVSLSIGNKTVISDNLGAGIVVRSYKAFPRLRVDSSVTIARNGQGNYARRDGICIDAPTENLLIETVQIYDDQAVPTQGKAIALRGPHTSVSPRIRNNDLLGVAGAALRIEQTVADQTKIFGNDTTGETDPAELMTNLITNPNFEVATAGTSASNCTVSRPTGMTPVSGSYNLRATCTSTSLAQASLAAMTVVPGDVITFSAFLRCTAGREIGLAIKDNINTAQYWTSGKHIADGNWRRVSFTWLVPDGVTQVRPSFWRYASNGAASGDLLDIDCAMWMVTDKLVDYFDGATNGGAWTGSANASTSTKTI